jgi:hypothetical protein
MPGCKILFTHVLDRVRVMISSRIWFLLEGFLEDYVFAWWNIWIFIILFFIFLRILFNVNGKATVWHTPCFFSFHIFAVYCQWKKGIFSGDKLEDNHQWKSKTAASPFWVQPNLSVQTNLWVKLQKGTMHWEWTKMERYPKDSMKCIGKGPVLKPFCISRCRRTKGGEHLEMQNYQFFQSIISFLFSFPGFKFVLLCLDV